MGRLVCFVPLDTGTHFHTFSTVVEPLIVK